MRKAYQAVSAVAGRILFIGFGIQIVLGICWMLCNFGGYQRFGDSLLYEEAGKMFIGDEYEGILYPVLIVITKGIEEFTHIPYRFLLYLLQIGFAFLVSYKALGCLGVKEKAGKTVGGLAMLTFPMAMQCHLAVLPDSLVSSLLVLELAISVQTFRKRKKRSTKEYMKVLLCWIVLTLLRPEYLAIGAVPVVMVFLYGLVKSWKYHKIRIFQKAVLTAAALGVMLIVGSLLGEEDYYHRGKQSLGVTLASRCVWTHAAEDYDSWPEEVKLAITVPQARSVDYQADNVERILVTALKEAVGEERTEALLLELSKLAWQRHRGEILHNTAWDVVGYTLSPLVIQRQFDGKAYDSYSGRNYDMMREKTPELSAVYMDYSCWWFLVALVLTAVALPVYGVLRLMGVVRSRKLYHPFGGKVLALLTCLGTSGLLVGIYSLRGAGMMDYKKSVAVTLLWIVSVLLVQNKMLNEESKENERKKEM